jgi:hypothetical protein
MNRMERDALCAALVDALADRGDPDPLASLAAALPKAPPPAAAVGQLWRVVERGARAQALVALTHVSEHLRGVTATEDTFVAATDDLLVAAADSPTGAPLALHAWRDVPVAADALQGFVGQLPEPVVTPLRMLLQRTLTGGFVLRAREALPDGSVRWSIAERPGSPEASFVTGPRIADAADGRVAARAALRDASAWIEADALDALGEPEPEPWHARVLARLRGALGALGAVFDVDGVFGDAPAGLEGGLALAGALRHPNAPDAATELSFALSLADVRVCVRIHLRDDAPASEGPDTAEGGEADLLVVAETADGRPFRGAEVSLRAATGLLAEARTDRTGTATLTAVRVPPGALLDIDVRGTKHVVPFG